MDRPMPKVVDITPERLRTIRDVLLGASCSLHIPRDTDGQMRILYPAVEEAIALLDLLVGAPYSDEEHALMGAGR